MSIQALLRGNVGYPADHLSMSGCPCAVSVPILWACGAQLKTVNWLSVHFTENQENNSRIWLRALLDRLVQKPYLLALTQYMEDLQGSMSLLNIILVSIQTKSKRKYFVVVLVYFYKKMIYPLIFALILSFPEAFCLSFAFWMCTNGTWVGIIAVYFYTSMIYPLILYLH